jgi:hypothetical protein
MSPKATVGGGRVGGNDGTWAARYDGFCDLCTRTYARGTVIKYEQGYNFPVHAVCPDEPEPRPICPRCNLEVPATGDCC